MLENELNEAVSQLLVMARSMARNYISGHCDFILSEIKGESGNLFEQLRIRKSENDHKTPTNLSSLMPTILALYDNLHDINLYVYSAKAELTVIDIRYYLKSSLEESYRLGVANDPPMLHCKVCYPPYSFRKNEKFDINWEHKTLKLWWKMLWLRQLSKMTGHQS